MWTACRHRDQWDELPPAIADGLKKRGKGNYIAAPVNVHRVNWLWANPEAFKKAGAKLPTTWGRVLRRRGSLEEAGVIRSAARRPGTGRTSPPPRAWRWAWGADYKKALRSLDAGPPLAGETMQKVLETFKKVRATPTRTRRAVTGTSPPRWSSREAGMQLMGDWAKGEFIAAGKVPGKSTSPASPRRARAKAFTSTSTASRCSSH